MNNEKPIYLPYTQVKETDEKDVKSIISRYVYHWPMFVICIVVAFGLAFLYLQTQKPGYRVMAKISIKDEKSTASSEKDAALQQLNISSQPKLIESEVEIIRSRPIISKLVKDLELWVTYTEPQRFREVDLYAAAPFSFKLLKQGAAPANAKYVIRIMSASRFSYSKNEEKPVEADFNDTFASNFGHWKLTLAGNPEEWIGRTVNMNLRSPNQVTSEFQSRIATVINKSAPIVDLKLDDEVPERGEAVLNKLIQDYQKFNINEKNKETESTLKFIDERLASLTGELTNAEKDVEGYKSSIGLTDISSKSQYYLQNVQMNDTRMNEVNVQLNVLSEIEKYAGSEDAESVPATIGITDPGLVSLVAQLSKLQLQKDRLLAITPENNPIFTPLNKQINSTKAAMSQNIQSIKASLLSTRRQLDKINSKFEGSIRSIPGQERQYVSIKRQQGTKESLYLYLLQKREEVAMSYASTLTDVHTVESAFAEALPSKKPFVYSFALLAALILAAGFIYGREAIRNKVLTRKQIEKTTSVQIISELVREEGPGPIVIANSRSSSVIGEQFRALRTSLLQIDKHKERGKVILFTSSISGEGKSFVSSNIAASLAVSGRKTIILELDLRKPKLTNVFKLNTECPGLTDLLTGKASKEEVIQQTAQNSNLYAMRAGAAVENPSELLEGKEMAKLIEALRFEYDNILIDSPPLRLVTDAMILAPLSDITLYLIRQGYTGKEELEFIKQLEAENKLPNLKLIFNGMENERYGYGYQYDYSYYNVKNSKGFGNYVGDILKRF